MTALCMRGLTARRALHWLAAALVFAAAASQAMADEAIVVALDQSRVLKIPERATTVVIGNPLIADLTLEPGGLAILTGKSYGATNVLVMDRSGAVLNEQTVEVRGPSDQTVVVYRGITRETYSCRPDCQPRIALGDNSPFFNEAINQANTRNTQSMAAGAASAR